MELIALIRSIDFSDFFLFFFLMVEIGKWNSVEMMPTSMQSLGNMKITCMGTL